jgi:hypothetical protein
VQPEASDDRAEPFGIDVCVSRCRCQVVGEMAKLAAAIFTQFVQKLAHLRSGMVAQLDSLRRELWSLTFGEERPCLSGKQTRIFESPRTS